MQLSPTNKYSLNRFLVSLYAFLVLLLPNTVFSEDLTTLKNQVQNITEQRINLENEVTVFDNQIKFLEEQIVSTQKLIDENKVSIEKNEKELKKQQLVLSEYLATMYEEDQVSFFEILLRAQSFSDFVDRKEYLETLREKVKNSYDQIDSIQKSLEKERQNLKDAQNQQNSAKVAIEKQKQEKETSLTVLKEEERKIRQRFAERLSKYGSGAYCKDAGKIIKSKYSVFSFPINCGFISQGYGSTEFASIDKAYGGAIHNGVDVGVGTGTEIKSIGNGTVYAKGSSPSGGWGNWVIVKQDKVKIENNEYEFYTLYAHMVSETYLEIGDRVNNSSIIGWVGGTPNWAPHLHFSLFLSSSGWNNNQVGPYPGNTVDPLLYIDIPISTAGTDWDPNFAH